MVTREDSSGATTLSYDADGNQTLKHEPSGSRTTSTWDDENRLTQVRLPSGTVSTFTYDGDDRRVRKLVGNDGEYRGPSETNLNDRRFWPGLV